MSTIKGEVREIKERTKKVGLLEGSVVAINPTLKELEEIGVSVRDDQSETEYLGTSRDGNTNLRVDVWLLNKHEDELFKLTFFLEDSIKMNRDETKTQYINNIGNCTWAESEELLPAWFSKRPYRKARNGEEHFYNFLRIWLGSLDYSLEETELEISWLELMRNDLTALREQIGGSYAVPFLSLATVVSKTKINEKTGEEEFLQYQNIYNKHFLPAFCSKYFVAKDYNDESLIEEINNKAFKDMMLHEKFIYNVTGDYGCKDYYELGLLTEYDASKNPITTEDPFLTTEDVMPSDGGSSY